jgi:CHAT domain-containing protein
VLCPALALLPELTRRHAARQEAKRGEHERLLALVDPWPLPDNPLPHGKPFQRVALTARYFDEVARLYQDADVRSGADATVAALAAASAGQAQPTVVHFGTHALAFEADKGDPLDSFVALAKDPADGQDGRLRARDLLGTTIAGNLVVLAACATGGGEVTGDGVVGLSRAFLAAGPTTLLLTLYEVGEIASLELTLEFHRQIVAEGRGPALALARAQREAITTGGDPLDWSAFVLYGLG